MEEKQTKTKLTIRVERPPISIFRMEKGKTDVDMTYIFESAFGPDAEHYFFMVPDGTYLVTQGDRPCVYEVKGGKVKANRVTRAPVGNTVEDLTAETKAAKGVTLAEIMHVSDQEKKPREKRKA